MNASLDRETAIESAFAAARAADERRVAKLGASADEDHYAQHLAAAILRRDPHLRAAPAILARAAGDPAALARLGIATRRPLAVVQSDPSDGRTYAGDAPLLAVGEPAHPAGRRGRRRRTPPATGAWARPSAPRAISPRPNWTCSWRRPRWWSPGRCRTSAHHWIPPRSRRPPPVTAPDPAAHAPDASELAFFNGWGGFSADGREYVIHVPSEAAGDLRLPPRPWTNVLANDTLGCIVSETGAGATWCGNSREHRLTPWFNDPLLDPHGDAVYLRDDDTGTRFSCLPGPAPARRRLRDPPRPRLHPLPARRRRARCRDPDLRPPQRARPDHRGSG